MEAEPNETLMDAIKETIKWGLSQNILSTFLTEQGAEVNSMLMTEYNVERAMEIKDEAHRAEIAEKDAKIAERDEKIAELEALVKQLRSATQ